MRWFLDMCIILYYIGEGDKESLIKKTKIFVSEKKGDKFFLCYYIKDNNIPRWLNRQKILFKETIEQIDNLDNSNYTSYNSKYSEALYDRDKNKIAKLIAFFRKTSDKKEFRKKLDNTYLEIEQRINSFIKSYIDEFIIPLDTIDSELKGSFMNHLNIGSPIKNESDAKTMCSAIQEHQNKELCIITADNGDWTKEIFEWAIPICSNLSKKYPSLPEIKYIQDIN